jgi:outer membrane protein OmpU
MNTFFSVGSINEQSGSAAEYNPTGLFSDGEVHFKGEYKHDNGITFGVNVQLEAFGTANSGDTIDERFIYIAGDFGRIVAGSENSAAYTMQFAAPYVGIPLNSGWVTSFVPAPAGSATAFRTPALSTYIDFGNDENVITYFTPRFAGFQIGVTYAPSVVGNGDGKNFPVEADTETEYSNGFAVGANFVEDFNGFGVSIAGGYRRASVDDTREAAGFDDYQAVSAGINLSYAGFTIGGSYANEFEGFARAGGSSEGVAWDVGISYAAGPWSTSVTYFSGEVESDTTISADDEMESVVGAVAYQVGPGINASVSVLWAEWRPETGGSQSGVVGAVGLQFSF